MESKLQTSQRLLKRSFYPMIILLFTGAWTSVSLQVSSEPSVLPLAGFQRSLGMLKEVCGKRGEKHLSEIARAANEASRKYQLSEELLVAMMAVESGCSAKARSGKGAIGLMQLMPGTAKELGLDEPEKVRANVFGGAKYLSGLLGQFDGNVKIAVAAYNAGPAAVRKHKGNIPPYKETKKYVSGVLNRYQSLKNLKEDTLAASQMDA